MPISKELLSGSTGGKSIKVGATATAGTLIHTTGVSATIKDEVTLFAHNTSASAVKLTIEFGDVASPDDLIEITIPPEVGPIPIIPGYCLVGTGAAGREVRAFAGTTNVLTINGWVNRIS